MHLGPFLLMKNGKEERSSDDKRALSLSKCRHIATFIVTDQRIGLGAN